MRGQGPGGQHRNKTESACRVTHVPTGTTAYADERSFKHSYSKALSVLEERLLAAANANRAAAKKARRDDAIHNTVTIRTYDYRTGVVKDHRNKKSARIKDVVDKGNIELLR